MEIIVIPEKLKEFVDTEAVYENIDLTECMNLIHFSDIIPFVQLLSKKTRMNGTVTIKCVDLNILAKYILNKSVQSEGLSQLIQSRKSIIDKQALSQIFVDCGFIVSFCSLEHLYYNMKFRRVK